MVSLEMKGGTETVLDTVAQKIDVSPLPYLAAGPRVVPAGQPVRIDAELRVEGQPKNAADLLGEDPAAAVVAGLEDERGHVLATRRLDWGGGSHFAAAFAYRPTSGQRLTINLKLASRDRSGAVVTDAVRLLVVARLTTGMVWRRLATLTLAAAVAVFVVLLLLWGAWWLSRPPLPHDRYLVESKITTLSARRLVRVGSGWPRQPVVWIWRTRRGAVSHRGRLPLPLKTRTVPRATPLKA